MQDLEKNKHENHTTSKLFVLINCIDDKVKTTIEELRRVAHVLETKQIDGPYDIIVTIQSTSNEELKKTLHKIRQLQTVRHTLTLRSSSDDGVLG
ncbi:MAG: Lrp/AsnC ligand binding domain-containing protein [Nitrososphaera sp.]|jgi:DNA-binding Lrp family transcriptional regulator